VSNLRGLLNNQWFVPNIPLCYSFLLVHFVVGVCFVINKYISVRPVHGLVSYWVVTETCFSCVYVTTKGMYVFVKNEIVKVGDDTIVALPFRWLVTFKMQPEFWFLVV
jgi:hypothetical protein